jgi:hypothetical protein
MGTQVKLFDYIWCQEWAPNPKVQCLKCFDGKLFVRWNVNVSSKSIHRRVQMYSSFSIIYIEATIFFIGQILPKNEKKNSKMKWFWSFSIFRGEKKNIKNPWISTTSFNV